MFAKTTLIAALVLAGTSLTFASAVPTVSARPLASGVFLRWLSPSALTSGKNSRRETTAPRLPATSTRPLRVLAVVGEWACEP